MNFDNIPELQWQYGYLWALGPDGPHERDPLADLQGPGLALT